MGCTNGKTSNPNKNLQNNPVQQKPVPNPNQTLPNNQSSMIQNTSNQPAINQSMTTPVKVPGPNENVQNSANLGYQGSNNQTLYQGSNQIGYQEPNKIVSSQINQGNGISSSIHNSVTASPANNLNNSQMNHNSHIGSPHVNGSVHASGFKPNQIETHNTTDDDEIVNQEKSMNFDLGIKFNMQIEVQ